VRDFDSVATGVAAERKTHQRPSYAKFASRVLAAVFSTRWNGGLAGLAAACAAAGFGDLDDGAEPRLPASLRNRAIAALGNAVIPQIPQAIGHAMKGLT
jgi:hypothetical protein